MCYKTTKIFFLYYYDIINSLLHNKNIDKNQKMMQKKSELPHNSLLYNWRRILTVPFPASFSASTPYKATPLIMNYAFA